MNRSSEVTPAPLPAGWRTARIQDFCSVAPGGRLRLTKADYGSGTTPAYSAAGQDGFVSVTEFHEPGVVLSSIGARCGKCFYADVSWTTLANTQVIIPDGSACDARYLWQYVNSESYWHRSGSAQPFIAPSTVKGAWVALPPISEQRKIADILSSVDGAIEGTQVVINELQAVKKTVMRELLTPRIDWRTAPGENLFTIYGGYGPSAVRFDSGGDRLFLKVDDFNLDMNRRWVVGAALRFVASENPSIRTFGPGSVVFAKRGAAIFKNRVRVLAHHAAVDPNLMVLVPQDGVDPWFLAYQLYFIGLHNLSDSSTIPQINNKHLYPYMFSLPPSKEQNKIRGVLEAVDIRIEAEEQERRMLLELKSALLSLLLSGEIRVTPDPEPTP